MDSPGDGHDVQSQSSQGLLDSRRECLETECSRLDEGTCFAHTLAALQQEKLYSYSCRCYRVGSVWLGGIEHFIPLRLPSLGQKLLVFPVFFS